MGVPKIAYAARLLRARRKQSKHLHRSVRHSLRLSSLNADAVRRRRKELHGALLRTFCQGCQAVQR